MGIRFSGKSKSPIAKEALKIASSLSSFKFERGDYYTAAEGEKLSEAIRVLVSISNRI
jgi:hypothetical protein